MGRTIGDILAEYEAPTRTVPICLKPGLVAEYEEAAAVLSVATRNADSIGGGDPAGELAARVEALRQQITDASEVFTVTAISQGAWSDLVAACPDNNPDESKRQAFDVERLVTKSIAACTVDPEMTEDDARKLRDVLSKPQVELLANTIYNLNNLGADIPFDVSASANPPSPDEK